MTISPTRKGLMLERDGHRCLHCGASERLVPDHVVPLIRGGSNELTNLQTLCVACNSRKRDKDAFWVSEFGPDLMLPVAACDLITTDQAWRALRDLLRSPSGYFYCHPAVMDELIVAGIVTAGPPDGFNVRDVSPGSAFGEV